MKLLSTILILIALGLSACNSNLEGSSNAEVGKKTMENKPADKSATDKNPETNSPDSEFKITDTYWKLIKLEGKDIANADNPHDQPHFMLITKDYRVSGNGGCNGFFGSYTLVEKDNRIKFEQLGSTKRMCADTVVNEHEFMQVLGQADSYKVIGDKLELYVGRRAPLAAFKAVRNKTK